MKSVGITHTELRVYYSNTPRHANGWHVCVCVCVCLPVVERRIVHTFWLAPEKVGKYHSMHDYICHTWVLHIYTRMFLFVGCAIKRRRRRHVHTREVNVGEREWEHVYIKVV